MTIVLTNNINFHLLFLDAFCIAFRSLFRLLRCSHVTQLANFSRGAQNLTMPENSHSCGPGVTVGAINGLKAVPWREGASRQWGEEELGKPWRGGGGQYPTGSTPRYAQMTPLMDLVYGAGHREEGFDVGGRSDWWGNLQPTTKPLYGPNLIARLTLTSISLKTSLSARALPVPSSYLLPYHRVSTFLPFAEISSHPSRILSSSFFPVDL